MKKTRKKHGVFFKTLMKIIKLFKKKPIIYNLNDEPLEQGIIISNHSAASGPLTMSLYFPIFFIPWGTFEMTGKYKERWNYLYHVFYQQKLGYGKFKSFLIATLFAVISKMLYNGMQLIPTYPNVNFRKTINLSKEHLNNGSSILIFPEDSNTGYHEQLIKYNNGFVYLSENHFKSTGINLPIYPIYYHKILNAMIIGEKVDINALREAGMNRNEIAEYFMNITNNLGKKLFKLERKSPKFSEESIFKRRLKTRINNIRTKYEDISIDSFRFLDHEKSLYERIMIDFMKSQDIILNNDNLTIRFYNR